MILILATTPLFSQVLSIRDKVSKMPLGEVAVFSETTNKHTTTDGKGRANISAFAGVQNITIRLLGYKIEVYSYEQLKEKQFRVFLEQKDITLDEVVVSATRWQQEKRDVPSRITAIKKKDIILLNPQTTADLLSMSGDVFIQKSQLGGGSPMIRGFATNRVLITIDGVRMNNAIFRSGNIQNVISLDPLSIETTEVLFGPGAVMYGSDALGGAMNFYTIDPKLTTSEKPAFSMNTLARYSTANEEKTGHFDFQSGFDKWALATSITYSNFGDLEAGKKGPDKFLRPEFVSRINDRDTLLINPNPRIQTPSGYNQLNLMQKIKYKPNDKIDFHYGFHYSTTSDVPRYDRLIEYNNLGILRDGEWYYGPQVWMMNVLNISHTADLPVYNKLKATIAFQQFEESRHNRNFNSSNLNHRTEKVDAYSFNLDFDKFLNEKQSLLYGFEAIINHIGSSAQRENILTQAISPLSTRYPDGSRWNSTALYANYLNRMSERITFQTGLRYNFIGIDATFDNTFFPFPFDNVELENGALTGSTGLAYKPSANWQLNMNLSTGFRAPNIDDIGKVFDSEPGRVIVPNPGLKPEYAFNADIGLTRIIKGKVKLDLTAYYTHLDNALVRREFTFNGQDSIMYDGLLSRVLAIQNSANARVYGIQALAEVKISKELGLISRFTWQSGEEEMEDGSYAPLRHAVPWFGLTRLTYTKNHLKAEIYALYQGEVKFDQMPPSEIAKPHLYATDSNGNPYSPGWMTLNLKALYQVSDFVVLTAGIENFTNALYRPYSSGISAPGTNLVLSVRASF